MNNIKFKTYSWVVGTTSFRVAETKYKIEKQLLILDSFKNNIQNSSWKEQQEEYFYSLVENGLAKEKKKIQVVFFAALNWHASMTIGMPP